MSKIDCDQTINGILLVNKSQGLSSNAVLQQIRRLYRAKKAGHTGSLDPLATGMLPICFGEATKFCQYLLDANKCYEATGQLGVKTNTGDAWGEVIAEMNSFRFTRQELLAVINSYKGKIIQVPPMFSALKHKGKPLYKYAREGTVVARSPREVTIHALKLMDFDGKNFSIRVSCSKGTYIRTLVEDIGNSLGVGAHVTQLHRVSTAGFTHDTLYSVDELHKKTNADLINCLLPLERAISYLPQLKLNNSEVLALRHGKTLNKTKNNENGCVRLYDEENCFIGLGEWPSESTLIVRRLLATAVNNCTKD